MGMYRGVDMLQDVPSLYQKNRNREGALNMKNKNVAGCCISLNGMPTGTAIEW